MSTDISNSDKVIDSRDVIARIDELQSELDGLNEDLKECEDADPPDAEAVEDAQQAHDEWLEENGLELDSLKAFAEEAEGYAPDWTYGATLIHEDYFEDYCREMCVDIGDLPKDIPGYLVIDWAATAENLKVDYTQVDFGGETYYVR